MKYLLKKLLQYYLKYITKLTLLFHRPIIIAIAGSTNKTFVRENIVMMLKEKNLSVRSNPRSFNTEIGLPLAILNLPSGYNSYKNWLPIIFRAILAIFSSNFPKMLVLELGIDQPRDMKILLSIIKPDIVILTDITQRYIESFADMDELVGEYEYLIRQVKNNGVAILNYDNLRIRKLSEKAKVKVIFFSLNKNQKELTDIWLAGDIITSKSGLEVKINYGASEEIHKINRFGLHHVYALLITLIIKKEIVNI